MLKLLQIARFELYAGTPANQVSVLPAPFTRQSVRSAVAVITARNLVAEAPVRQADQAAVCKAAPRRYRCLAGAAHLRVLRTAWNWI